MAGFDAPYVPGWDCHGLPIEIKVDSELGSRKAKMTASEIRGECRKYAQKYVELHRREFKRLGVFGEWENPYLTMSAGYEAVIAKAFVDFLDQGLRLQGPEARALVHARRTALAEAEVEYEDHASPSIWVRFALTSDPAKIAPSLAGRRVWGLIWTTTPWTIPANMAIAFHPKFEYVAVEAAGDVYIVAQDLLKTDHREVRLGRSQDRGEFPRQQPWKAPSSGTRSSTGTPPAFWRNTSRWSRAPARCTPRPGTARRTTPSASSYGIPTYCPVDAGGRLYHAEGAAGRSAGGDHRADGLGR